jgi:hypothetical protein
MHCLDETAIFLLQMGPFCLISSFKRYVILAVDGLALFEVSGEYNTTHVPES